MSNCCAVSIKVPASWDIATSQPCSAGLADGSVLNMSYPTRVHTPAPLFAIETVNPCPPLAPTDPTIATVPSDDIATLYPNWPDAYAPLTLACCPHTPATLVNIHTAPTLDESPGPPMAATSPV